MSHDYAVHILAFGPHPDDVELCCGGLLLKMAAQGYLTAIVDLTRGELGTNGTPEIRAQEAREAAKILGVSLRENLGFPDGWIHPWSGYEDAPQQRATHSQLARVVEMIRRLRPEMILIPWRETRHPDHQSTSDLLTKAMFFSNLAKFETDPPTQRFAPRQVLYYQMRDRFRPSFVVDISDFAEKKWQAACCHESQFGSLPSSIPTSINANKALDAMVTRDRYYGAMIGVPYGEAYLCRNTLGIHDPLEHFRHNDYPHAYFFETTP